MSRTTIFDDPYVRVIGPDTEQTFLAELGKAGMESGHPDAKGEYTSQCPAHPDQVRSLRWRVSVDGRILLHCQAGCSFDEVAKSMELETWQLQPVKVEYDYIDRDGVYRYTVIREYKADGKKAFKQGVRSAETGMWTANVDGIDTNILFRADAIASGERGACHTLWLAEGEKDACVVEIELAAEGRDGEYASTFPGGAGRDLETVIADQIVATGARTVVVVVDRDKSGAGLRRGRNIARWLADHAPDLAVRIMIPIEGTGKDVAEIVDKFGDGWEARLEAYTFDAAEDAMLDYGTSAASGMFVIAKSEVGRAVTCMVKPGKEEAPITVLTGVIEPEAVHTSATVGRKYAITVTPQIHVADPMSLEITSADLSSSQNFLRWLSRVPDFGRAPLSGIPVGDIADGLRMYLDYRVRVAGKPVLISPEAVGWVDAVTGVTADRAASGAALVFVDRDGRIVAATDVEAAGVYAEPETRHGGTYGFAGTELTAAWAFWQALTFADPEVTAPLAGFVGATILSPFTAAAGAGLRPGLTMVAPSGSGKTHGAGSLILGLGGCSGHQSGSAAGMRRKLEAGVGTMLWFDDTAAVEETRMKEWMRVAITRSEFTLSDTDAGVNAVHGGGLTSVPVVSSEGVGWMAETAMRDRFIAVHPTNPQGRKSMWPGRENDAQWADVQSVEVGLLRGRPNEVAGWVVAGIVDAMRRRGAGDVYKGVEDALVGAERGGLRREWARSVAEVGLEAVIGWLERVRDESGAAWPGHEAGEWGTSLDRLREGWRVWAALGEDRTAVAACSLVDEVIPRLLQAHHDAVRSHAGYSEFAITGINAGGRKEMPEAIRHALSIGGGDTGLERGLPPLIIDDKDRIWVRTAAAASEYRKLVRTAEERTTGASALAGQIQSPSVCDDPAWAAFIKGGRTCSGVRVRTSAGEAVYRRLSAVACQRVAQ